MDCDEFLATLDKKNPFYQEFCAYAKATICKDLIAYPKGEDLLGRVRELCQKQLYPIIDRKLQMVIGIPEGGHQSARWLLYTYHSAYDNPGLAPAKPQLGAFWYVNDGLGYYIPSLRPNAIVIGIATYKQDEFDVQLFSSYKLLQPQ